MSLQVIINLYQTSLNKRSSCLLILVESVRFKSFISSIKVLPVLLCYSLTVPAILWMPTASSAWCLQVTKWLPVTNWPTSFLKNFQGVWGKSNSITIKGVSGRHADCLPLKFSDHLCMKSVIHWLAQTFTFHTVEVMRLPRLA